MGTQITLHAVAASLPLPTLATDGGRLDQAGIRWGSYGDLSIEKSTIANSFSIEGPVYVCAFVKQDNALNARRWAIVDTLELTTLDLTLAVDKGYRIRISPWWARMALHAPNWIFNAGENVNVRLRTYLD